MTALDEGALRAALGDCGWIDELVVAGELDSTNDEVRRRQSGGASGSIVVVADRQRAGRGRRGRRWDSAGGVGLYLSVGLPDVGAGADAPRMTLAASVAACQACRALGASGVGIDWPNDLVCDGRKLGGILAEFRSVAGRGEMIVGTGINVHQDRDAFGAGLRDRATSLRLVTAGREPSRELLAGAFLERLGAVVHTLRHGDWPAVAARFTALAVGVTGRRVRVTAAGDESPARGVTAGIAGDGALRVRLDDGTLREVRQADTVREEGEA